MKPKTEYIKVDNLNDAFRMIFSGENIKAITIQLIKKPFGISLRKEKKIR